MSRMPRGPARCSLSHCKCPRSAAFPHGWPHRRLATGKELNRNDRRCRPQAFRLLQRPARPQVSAAGRRHQRAGAGARSSSPTTRCARAPTPSRSSSPRARRSTTSWCRRSPPCARRPSARIGQRHFDVQLIGGMILHEGQISEMKTGEGKTLVATLPVYLNALAGRGVHVVTVNDYLAKRDAEWMGQIYGFLGLTTGVIVHGLDDEQRKTAYDCDVTYGTNNELGFDYLRDNMKYRMEDMVQRGHIFAIVDEVDSILIDEARTPLIISGPLDDRSDFYNTIDAYIPKLDKADYEVDEKQRTVDADRSRHGEAGAAAARRRPAQGRVALRRRERLDRAPRQPGAARPQAVPARQGLHRAQRRGRHHRRVHRPHDAGPALFGRAAPGARSQGAPADPAGEPDARLDHVPELLPHVREARRHDRHGADRGRRVHGHLQPRSRRGADQPADDPRRPGRRGLSHQRREIPRDHRAARGLQDARPAGAGRHHLDREIRAARRDAAQARLGAARLHRSERVRRALFSGDEGAKKTKVFAILNARYHEQEAYIVSQAGVPGAITIATNMAGRGTDIQLGGNADMRIRQELDRHRRTGASATRTRAPTRSARRWRG